MTSHVKFIHLVTCIGSLFLFIRSSFPLYGCDTACLPVLLWSVSSFWLWMFLHKPFCGHNVFISLGSVPRSGIAGSKEAVTSCSWNDALCSVVKIVSIRQPLVAHLHCRFLWEPLPECFRGKELTTLQAPTVGGRLLVISAMGSHIALFSVTALQNFGTVTTSSLSTAQNNCLSLLIHLSCDFVLRPFMPWSLFFGSLIVSFRLDMTVDSCHVRSAECGWVWMPLLI